MSRARSAGALDRSLWICFLMRSTCRLAKHDLATALSQQVPLRLRMAALGTVTLVEFSDFQCPYCAHFYHTLDSLIAEYPQQLRVLYRHFPITSLHPEARSAALAAECAGREGRFRDYYDALFRNQGRLPSAPWLALADEIGVDPVALARCMEESDVDGRIAADSAMVVRLGLRGTPTVIIDGWQLPGTPSGGIVRGHIEAALKAAEKPSNDR